MYDTKTKEHLARITDLADPEDLEDIIESFQTFPEAFEAWCKRNGHTRKELLAAFHEANLPDPRMTGSTISRERARQIAIACGLSPDEANDFFRRACLQHPLYPHDIQDCLCRICLENKMSLKEYEDLCQKLEQPESIPLNTHPDPTTDSLKELNEILAHPEYFSSRRVTAWNDMKDMWKKIQVIAYDENHHFSEDTFLKAASSDNDHLWDYYLWIILGNLECKDQMNNRSLNSWMKQSSVIHPFVYQDFPSRQSLMKFLEGNKTCEDETIRKMMILLHFYRYWAPKRRKIGEIDWASFYDKWRHDIDNHLKMAGFAPLYAGNPYDWLFLSLSSTEDPVDTFRYFMRELQPENQTE